MSEHTPWWEREGSDVQVAGNDPHAGWWGSGEDLADILEESLFGMTEGTVEVVDGCIVEPDGSCEHGFLSPLLEAGVI